MTLNNDKKIIMSKLSPVRGSNYTIHLSFIIYQDIFLLWSDNWYNILYRCYPCFFKGEFVLTCCKIFHLKQSVLKNVLIYWKVALSWPKTLPSFGWLSFKCRYLDFLWWQLHHTFLGTGNGIYCKASYAGLSQC